MKQLEFDKVNKERIKQFKNSELVNNGIFFLNFKLN
jgi:hypothetical protein